MRPFIEVSVLLTAKEYESIFHEACLTGPSTCGAAIRKRLGWQETPYGYVKWAKEQAKQTTATSEKDNASCF